MTDGEPHVMASPVRLIAPLYQIHPRLARGCGPGDVDAVVSRNIRVRSIFFVDQNQIFLFYDFIIRGILFGNYGGDIERSFIYFLSVERQKLIFGNQILLVKSY